MTPLALPGDIMANCLHCLVQLPLINRILKGQGMQRTGPCLVLLWMAFSTGFRGVNSAALFLYCKSEGANGNSAGSGLSMLFPRPATHQERGHRDSAQTNNEHLFTRHKNLIFYLKIK